MKICDNFTEISKEQFRLENIKVYSEITDNEYTQDQLLSMEKMILNSTSFDIYKPNSFDFLEIVLKNMSESIPPRDFATQKKYAYLESMSKFITDLSVFSIETY